MSTSEPKMINVKLIVFLQLLFATVYSAAVIKPEDAVSSFRTFLEKSIDGQYQEPLTPELGELQTKWSHSGKFEGDIVMTPEQIEERVQDFAGLKNADTNPRRLWPNNIVYYGFTSAISSVEIADIEKAIAAITKVTCLTFKRSTSSTPNYIRFENTDPGCWAYIGMIGGPQKLNLQFNGAGKGCYTHGVVIHEILHALGFHHMQSTYNRDDYVRVIWEKIKKEEQYNFNKRNTNEVSNLGFVYDYGSVMHYGLYDFSIDGSKTMEAIQSTNEVIGQTVGMSSLDVKRLNKLYSCPGY